jgi:hypothetical protein
LMEATTLRGIPASFACMGFMPDNHGRRVMAWSGTSVKLRPLDQNNPA